MLKRLTFVGLLLTLTANVIAQTNQLTVTPRQVAYTRKFVKISDSKRIFKVRYPVITDVPNALLKRKIENTVSYWRVFDTSLKENLSQSDWLENLDYRVNYNKKGILDIALFQEGSGAYPDTGTVNLIVNLKTGAQAKFTDVFKSNSLPKLASLVDKKLQTEKREIIERIDQDISAGNEDAESGKSFKEQVSNLKFTTENFNEFSIGDKGVTILYDAGFPHVIQALQPDGQYFFTYAELKSFIKPEGLLGKFIR